MYQNVLNVCESRVLIQWQGKSPRHAAENSQQRLGGKKNQTRMPGASTFHWVNDKMDANGCVYINGCKPVNSWNNEKKTCKHCQKQLFWDSCSSLIPTCSTTDGQARERPSPRPAAGRSPSHPRAIGHIPQRVKESFRGIGLLDETNVLAVTFYDILWIYLYHYPWYICYFIDIWYFYSWPILIQLHFPTTLKLLQMYLYTPPQVEVLRKRHGPSMLILHQPTNQSGRWTTISDIRPWCIQRKTSKKIKKVDGSNQPKCKYTSFTSKVVQLANLRIWSEL